MKKILKPKEYLSDLGVLCGENQLTTDTAVSTEREKTIFSFTYQNLSGLCELCGENQGGMDQWQ